MSYALTKSRVLQWLGIILILAVFAGAYWYFQVFAGVKTNTSLTDPLSEGLAGYWKLDEGSGTSVSDSSTNGNTGTLTNGPTWTTGQIGSAVSFDGTNDYVDLGSSAAYNIVPGDKVSTAFWYYSNQGNGSTGTVYRRSSGSCDIFAMSIMGGASTDTLGFYYRDTSCGGIDNSQVTGITKNAWHHVVSTYNTVSGVFTVYVDGAQRATSTTIPSANISISGTFQLGTSGGSNYFNGYLDELRLYRYVLSADEVSQLYRLNAPTGVDTSLKGYWTFDGADISGTTATDRSGAGNTGTLTNGPTVTQGKVGQALSFDGTDDSVNITNITYTGEVTLAAWFYTSDNAQASGIIFGDNNGSSAGGQKIGIASGNFFVRAVSAGSSDATVAVPTANEWHYLVITRNSSNKVDLYVDGGNANRLFGDVAQSGTNTLDKIGQNGADASGFFSGKLDEVRMYNRALSAAEIQAQYKAGQSDEVNTGASQAQGGSRLDSGLAGYWKMDDGSGTSATDASTNANTGTLTNGPTWGTGQIGGAVDFDGNDDYVYVPYSSALISSQNLTYALWVRPDLNEFKGLLGSLNGEEGSAFNYLSIDNSGAEAGNPSIVMTRNIGGSTTTRAVQFAYTVSTWLHYTYTYNGSVERVYINGVRVGEWSQTGNFATNTENGILLGKVNTLSSSLDGLLDEVRVYTRALPEDEVVQLYRLNAPTGTDTGLKGYWSFNGKDVSGTSAYDRSGAGNTGTLTNGPTVTPGKVGQALSFDGTDDYVDTGTRVGPSSAYSNCSWVKPGSVSGAKTIFSAYSDTGGVRKLYTQFFINGAGFQGRMIGVYSSGFHYIGRSVASGLVANQWSFLCMTWDGGTTASSIKLYQDGVQVDTTNDSGGTFTTVSSDSVHFWIGAQEYTGVPNNPMRGQLDEVRVYNRALSAAEIQAQYKAGQSDEVNTGASQAQGGSRLDSGLAGYWKLDEGSGTTVTDSSTNGISGTFTLPTWTTGRIGGALNFGAVSNGYVALTDSPVFDVGGAGSWCHWFNADTGQTGKGMFQHEGSGTYKWMTYITSSSSAIGMYVRVGGNTYGAFGPSGTYSGTWRHLCGTFDKNLASARLKLYLDGVLVGSDNAASGDIESGDTPRMGTWFSGGGEYGGKLDEVRIYNRALSADEVAELSRLNAPTGTDTGLKGYWSFNGKDVSGTTAYDRSGAGNNGTLTNGPTVTPGKLGQALSFSEVNDTYVNIGTSSALDFTSALSLSAWVKPDTANENNRGIAGRWVTGTNGYMAYLSNGKLRCYVDGTYSESVATLSNTGDWYHLGCSWDGTTIRGYINGVADGTAAKSAPSTADTGMKFVIGSYGYGNPNLDCVFDGKIDEVRLYNRGLTEAEIKSLYNASR